MRLYACERNYQKSSKIAKIESGKTKNPEIFINFGVFLNFLAKCMSTDMLKSFLDAMFQIYRIAKHLLSDGLKTMAIEVDSMQEIKQFLT